MQAVHAVATNIESINIYYVAIKYGNIQTSEHSLLWTVDMHVLVL